MIRFWPITRYKVGTGVPASFALALAMAERVRVGCVDGLLSLQRDEIRTREPMAYELATFIIMVLCYCYVLPHAHIKGYRFYLCMTRGLG